MRNYKLEKLQNGETFVTSEKGEIWSEWRTTPWVKAEEIKK